MNRLVCCFALLLTACGERTEFGPTPPEAYLDWRDQLVARTGRPMLGREAPCIRTLPEEVGENFEDYWLPTEKCVRMSEARRCRGVWAIGEEMTKFCQGDVARCERNSDGEQVWLSWAKDGWDKRADVSNGIYRVEFTGRKTIYPGSFGHLGGYDAEIVVDRLVSIEKLPGGEDPALYAAKVKTGRDD